MRVVAVGDIHMERVRITGYLTTLGLNLHGQGKIINGGGFLRGGRLQPHPLPHPERIRRGELLARLEEGRLSATLQF